MRHDHGAIHVWAIEDDLTYRKALVDIVDETSDMEMDRVFDSCEDAVDRIERASPPHVILLDIGLPGIAGTEGVALLKAASPSTQIVMLTVHEDEHTIFESICAGASGYLTKRSGTRQIMEAVREVHAGGVPFTPVIARKVLTLFSRSFESATESHVTDREKDILALMSTGNTQKQIADHLRISPHTVDTHIRNIYEKLHVHSGVEAVARAIRKRLI